MARYDMPALVDYVLRATKKEQIYFVGYSQGSIVGTAAFSQNLTLGSKIKEFYHFAPFITLGHAKSPIRILAPFVRYITTNMTF